MLVFARMGSTRFPGKMLAPLCGTPLAAWMLRRAMLVGRPVILASTVDAADDPLEQLGLRLGVPVFRGAVEDVLGRALACAAANRLHSFARLCGDRPLFDIAELRLACDIAEASPAPDLVSNRLDGPVPPGLTTEVIRVEALRRCVADDQAREHLSSAMYSTPGIRRHALPGPKGDGAWAIDLPGDLVRIEAHVHASAAGRPLAEAWRWACAPRDAR